MPISKLPLRRWLRDNRGFLAFLLLFGCFRTAIADWNPVPSGSMRPTLLEGDVVFVNRLAYQLKVPLTDVIVARLAEPRRGDVVTFFSPVDRTRLIKRIVALPGDTVEMRAKRLLINGQPAEYALLDDAADAPGGLRLDESASAAPHPIQWLKEAGTRDDFGPMAIPADRFLMLGDNRDNSADSRYFGLVPRQLLIGRAERILISADILRQWQPRLDRFGQSLR